MVTSSKLYIDDQWIKVYILIIYIIHVKCGDIMLNHCLWLDVPCNFTYITNGISITNWDFSSSDRKHFKSYMFTLAKVDNHDVENFATHLSKI
jgi:ABC-type protease/lipase transport system fused ATPase/permease subunit